MTQVKICGITNTEDALAAVHCGAAALGFICYPPSPRYIKPDDVKKIINALPKKVVSVGVFVNETSETIEKIMAHCGLDMIQLHGDESPEFCRDLPLSSIIKAVELKKETDINRAFNYDVAAILVDSRHAGLFGGTGKKSNWDLASRFKSKKPFILSGGLNAENIAEALKTVVPDALDINSGVETSPGKKDHKKMDHIFKVIRTSDTQTGNTQPIFKKRII